jgi:chaperonin GroEL
MLGATKMGDGGKSLLNIDIEEDIGIAGRVVVDKYKTTLYDGAGDETEILKRVEILRSAKKASETPYDAQIIDDRLAALTNGIAKIGIGGITELEIKEKYDRVEDALNAARAAIQEGVIPGGGTTLLRIANSLDGINGSAGERILARALRAPIKQILENIGLSLTKDIEKKLMKNHSLVFDARNKEYKDCLEAGIIDPVKVTKTALENAISIAGLLSTSGGGIIYLKKPITND